MGKGAELGALPLAQLEEPPRGAAGVRGGELASELPGVTDLGSGLGSATYVQAAWGKPPL